MQPDPSDVPLGDCHCGCGQQTELVKVNHAPRGLVKGQPRRYVHGHNPVDSTPRPYVAPDVAYGYCHCGCGERTGIIKTTNRARGLVKGEPYRYVKTHHLSSPRRRWADDEVAVGTGTCACGCGMTTRLAPETDRRKGWIKGKPLRFYSYHRLRGPKKQRYEVRDCGYPTPCWVWLLAKSERGYGFVAVDKLTRPAHRYYYEQAKGPIPDGLQLDHLCRNPSCVNPDHLEPVTRAENARRGSQTRLTVEIVREMRLRVVQGESRRSLAREFGVSSGTVGDAVSGKNWRDI